MEIPAHLQSEIRRRVESGAYTTPDEVIRRALEALKEIEGEDERIRERNRQAIEEHRRGESLDGPGVMESLRRRNVAGGGPS